MSVGVERLERGTHGVCAAGVRGGLRSSPSAGGVLWGRAIIACGAACDVWERRVASVRGGAGGSGTARRAVRQRQRPGGRVWPRVAAAPGAAGAAPAAMKWGKVLQRRVDAEPDWAPYFVNYKKLKAVVRDVAAAAAAGGVVGGASDEGLLSLVAVAADGTIDDAPGTCEGGDGRVRRAQGWSVLGGGAAVRARREGTGTCSDERGALAEGWRGGAGRFGMRRARCGCSDGSALLWVLCQLVGCVQVSTPVGRCVRSSNGCLGRATNHLMDHVFRRRLVAVVDPTGCGCCLPCWCARDRSLSLIRVRSLQWRQRLPSCVCPPVHPPKRLRLSLPTCATRLPRLSTS